MPRDTSALLRCFEAAVDLPANDAEQEIGHAEHQVNALVDGAGFAEGIVGVLRTGGSVGRVRSQRARRHAARQHQDGEQHPDTGENHEPLHLLPSADVHSTGRLA